jgi:hypothetical protein
VRERGGRLALAVHDIVHPESGDLAHAEPREKAEHDREAVPLAVPVVGDDRQQPFPFGHRQNRGLLHPENLIQSIYLSENIIFSDLPEVDQKVKPKVSAGSSGNVKKCLFPYLLLWLCLLFEQFRPLYPQQPTPLDEARQDRL